METPPQKNHSKDLFIYLTIMITLYLSIIALINLLFIYIETSFPDILNTTYYYGSGTIYQYEEMVRWISMLLVSYPIYIGLTWYAKKDMMHEPEKRDLGIKKLFVHFTLFLAAITIIIDLITLVFNFLNGEITTQFLFKVFAVLLVAGAIFAYYLWDLRRETMSKPSRILAIVVSTCILVSIIMGFFIVGTPGQQRMRRLDEKRIQDLSNIESQTNAYWQQKADTPPSLQELVKSTSYYGSVSIQDPETGAVYEYTKKSGVEYQLCANFSLASEQTTTGKTAVTVSSWDHEKGRQCFDRKVSAEVYKSVMRPTIN